ncbi:MAG: excinuclease ABC subunit UvrC [Lactobacillales bacterium]|nr:excinuclease ABC subunit UvrC [Lactobacillales bacterium]
MYMDLIKKKLEILPDKPGCYLMKNKDNVIIYVGKAKNLKRRVSSYFNRTHTGKTKKLVSEIVDFEYIVVESETESLILEINLIKKHDPKYNILLRDDKSYPYIELTNEETPRLRVVRQLGRKKYRDRLYGPYPNVTAARSTVNLLNRIYPLRKCNTYSSKPCLYYHIKQCLGYCNYKIEKDKIKQMEKEIMEFLKGNHEVVTNKLTNDMNKYSENLEFEKAQELKEMIDYIKITLTKQKVEVNDNIDRDVIGYYVFKGYLSIQIFFIRSGRIQERISKTIELIDDVGEELTRFIATFYKKNVLIPKEILVPDIVDNKLLEEYLETSVKTPIKGVKNKLVEMANDNAKIKIEDDYEIIKKDEEKTYEANEELKKILKLDKLDRIELFDNSNLFGTFNVSGMVVFKGGLPAKNEYRKYKITNDKNDDYGTMREVIYRRYFRVLKDDLERPDLIIVDGGIGQINIAREVINSLNLNIKVVGLKKDNKHTTDSLLANDPIEEIKIDKKTNLFYYLERMQDEVHNFTISYHRKIRSKGSISSILDNVEGIGEIRKKELLKKYKTITKLKEATIEELDNILPHNISVNLKEFLDNYE